MSKKSMLKMLVALGVLSILSSASVYARDSSYTQKGSGPRYWIAYEDCWVNDRPIAEDRWQANIDWMAANFKDYGYDMISNDGWINGISKVNVNGYITSYNDSWAHDWTYWGNYIKAKGMKMGIYYNPTWVTAAAASLNCPVPGTSYHIKDIVNSNNQVDAGKAGAKEWIQGYVNYFKSVGAVYLRVDFLCDYENTFGTTKYKQVLQWISEAAGTGMEVSFVMPNAYNHAASEIPYGDMMRIDQDCWAGGWDHLSARNRGSVGTVWPTYMNAFDGFVGFSDVTNRGSLIADGDMMRMNTFTSDNEKRFEMSLFTMAGSPITIGDQYDTIGNNAWVYQNREVLELNEDGFVGDPLSRDLSNPLSQVWKGQIPAGKSGAGQWVVGLFNREDSAQTRSINFATDLGVSGSVNVRDLWAQTDLGNMSSYSITLAPHESRLIRIGGLATSVATPTFSVSGGTYISTQSVAISDATSGATIRYTTNGTDPTASSTLYTVPINISVTTTLKAKAFASGKTDSTITSATYTIVKNTLVNPGFETGSISGWTASLGTNYGVDSSDVHSGSYKTYFYGSNFQQKIEQTVNIANGTHIVKAWVKQNSGTPQVCRMELSNYGGSTIYTNITAGSSYVQISGTVTVTNRQINIAFYESSSGSANLQIDDITID